MSYGVRPMHMRIYRHLAKLGGIWYLARSHSKNPSWKPAVTDVIWLKEHDMVQSYWQVKDGEVLSWPERADEGEVSLYMLAVEAKIGF